MWKCSATTSIIRSGVISFLEYGEIRSLSVFSANSAVSGVWESLD